MSVIPRDPAFDHRDIRSATLPFKRDKDHVEKWTSGVRPAPGARFDHYTGEVIASNEAQRKKVRPFGQRLQEHKSHANKAPKPYGSFYEGSNRATARQVNKVDAIIDANDFTSQLSKSLLELLPSHSNNAQSAIHTAIRESADAQILYSFDSKGPSPSGKGVDIDLGGLVDIAEKKWANEQTDRILKGEYEVLDHDGETTVLGKGKYKKSPKQKAAKPIHTAKNTDPEDDDGFELI